MPSQDVRYKQQLIGIWNELAPRYHRRWAGPGVGPFQSTRELQEMLEIGQDSRILDVGCGTGAAINILRGGIGPGGMAVGLDASLSALRIAKKRSGADFVVADAETACLKAEFDVVTCQFALFFFPDAGRALQNIRGLMKRGGTLAVTVHGAGESVPYHRIILDEIIRVIPDYLPPWAPQMDRFGTEEALKAVVTGAGFGRIRVRERIFEYSPGTADCYWRNYTRYVAGPLRAKLNSIPAGKRRQIKRAVAARVKRFESDGRVVFPWKVLMLTARRL